MTDFETAKIFFKKKLLTNQMSFRHNIGKLSWKALFVIFPGTRQSPNVEPIAPTANSEKACKRTSDRGHYFLEPITPIANSEKSMQKD